MLNDSPTSLTAERVKYLRGNHIPAILFSKGNLMEERSEVITNAIRMGFIIGNHTYSHPYLSQLTLEECAGEIERTDRIIDRLYDEAGIVRPAKLFMFPFFDHGSGRSVLHASRLQRVLRDNGYQNIDTRGITYPFFRELSLDQRTDVYCTLNFQEWKNPTEDELVAKIDQPDNLFGGDLSDTTSADLYLMHDSEKTNPRLFYAIIDKLVARGIKFELPKFK